MKQLIQTPAAVINMNPKADRSWKLVFETPELSGEDVKLLADNFQGEGWLVFSPNEITTDQIPTERAETGGKTQSKRLRDVIYVLYEQRAEPGGDFEAFYRTQMEKLIDFVKSKLEPEV
jgi:hypothetical protein